MTTLNISSALTAQREQYAQARRIAAEVNQRIDELDQHAPAEVRAKRIGEIRRKTEQASQPLRVSMSQRARSARQQLSRQRFTAGTDSERVTQSLNEIDALEAQAGLTLNEAVTGNSDPIERLKVAHRMAALR